jgi:hypothetical protein
VPMARWAVPCGYGHWGNKQSELIIKALTITKSPPVLLLQALNAAQDVL